MLNLKLAKSPLFIIATVVVLALIIIAAFKITQKNDNPIIPSTNPDSGSSAAVNSPAASSQSTGQTGSPSAVADSSSGPPPLAPSGDFISNHHPGGSNPTSEASVCNTSAGAICYIQFTKGTDVKKLDQRTADAKGAAYWYWDAETAGLGSGSWTVSAVAILNGQTKTASDPQLLVVQ